MSKIVYNGVECLECGAVLESWYGHDYKTCDCPNMAMVDGGLDYGRYGAKDMRMIKTTLVYANQDFEYVRQYAARGSRGKDGKQPVQYVKLMNMENDYLQAVLDYGCPEWQRDLIVKEINYRKNETPNNTADSI